MKSDKEAVPEFRPGLLPNGLTLKEEAFCVHYAHSCNAREAYIHAYDVFPDDETGEYPRWVAAEGRSLLKMGHIRKRIAEERRQVEEVNRVTANQIMRQAREAYELAREMRQPGHMIGSTTLMARLAGHLVDKKEVVSKTEREMTREEVEEQLREACKEAGFVLERVMSAAREESS